MIRLFDSLAAWGTPEFEATLKHEVAALDPALLPLQAGLAHSSYVGCGEMGLVVLGAGERDGSLSVKIGVMYSGVDAGSCCADDPTPLNEQPEYCELRLDIDKATGNAVVCLVDSA